MNFNTTKILRGARPWGCIVAMLLLTACGGGGGGGSAAPAAPPDTTAPTTSAAPSVSGTTDTATTLSVTINENGTGYYLVQAFAAAAPTVAQVQAGTSFAMTANVVATPAISGLTNNTAYTIYFVAKDAANNVQAAVQSVPVTTLLTAGYVAQGGLIWMPVSATTYTYAQATTLCAGTINGLTRWRMPTQAELSALYTSGLMNAPGWSLSATWSSTPFIAGSHDLVILDSGIVYFDLDTNGYYVSCVRNNANVAPVADAGAAQNVAVGALVTLDGSASSDANLDPLTYSWTLTSAPVGSAATLSGATTSAPTFTADLAGDYVATLIVNDGTLDSTAATVTIGVGYVAQGGLTWMPVTSTDTWTNADTYCTTTTINGLTGWRQPTSAELSALYTSGAMNGQGWTLSVTWSSTQFSVGDHYAVYLSYSSGWVVHNLDQNPYYVSCVR